MQNDIIFRIYHFNFEHSTRKQFIRRYILHYGYNTMQINKSH